ncbi:AlpA family phage regulatory protein [Bradyrhizobium sp. 168]|uniref:helix-turn-helix transcriptional regulator n=1 Tax=Bradyrhizobium sp. 168 TaxID=2782639 RepID=UPI001FFB4450|nr:AlpA family phage regulatory protein [Bradyrhizobium sp. 168]MCK1578693.1 AlpA family phage regulatory protein [Bradyrhizobium sp. 168]
MNEDEKTAVTKKPGYEHDFLPGLRKMISWRQLLRMIPLSRTAIEIKIKEGSFPRPYPLTKLKLGFFLDEIVEWQRQLVEQEANRLR